MSRTVAGRRPAPEPEPERPVVTRNYPVDGPWSQEQVVQWLMANGGEGWPRWRAVAATAIAIAMRSNSEPVKGGLVIIRVVPGGFELERRTGNVPSVRQR